MMNLVQYLLDIWNPLIRTVIISRSRVRAGAVTHPSRQDSISPAAQRLITAGGVGETTAPASWG
jgi:hypothetical protein